MKCDLTFRDIDPQSSADLRYLRLEIYSSN